MDSARNRRTGNRRAGDWSAVIVNYNGDPFLPACLDALGRVRLSPKQVFVVDNASTDGSLYELHGYPWVEAIKNPTNIGFAGGANVGLARVETSIAVILNPDVELAPEYGDALIAAFGENPRLGVAGTLLTFPDGVTVQHAGGVIKYPTLHTDHRGRGAKLSPEFETQVNIDYATGAALAVRMEASRPDRWIRRAVCTSLLRGRRSLGQNSRSRLGCPTRSDVAWAASRGRYAPTRKRILHSAPAQQATLRPEALEPASVD